MAKYKNWKEFKKAWVKALRSGQYKQTTGSLCTPGEKHDRFCCLGVAANLLIEGGHKGKWVADHVYGDTDFFGSEGSSGGQLTGTGVPKWLHEVLTTYDNPGFKGEGAVEDGLINMNDKGKSFKQIADKIEKYL